LKLGWKRPLRSSCPTTSPPPPCRLTTSLSATSPWFRSTPRGTEGRVRRRRAGVSEGASSSGAPAAAPLNNTVHFYLFVSAVFPVDTYISSSHQVYWQLGFNSSLTRLTYIALPHKRSGVCYRVGFSTSLHFGGNPPCCGAALPSAPRPPAAARRHRAAASRSNGQRRAPPLATAARAQSGGWRLAGREL